ncbi:MAG: Na/Pi cotransporter family protein [Planctomycetota bacterium]
MAPPGWTDIDGIEVTTSLVGGLVFFLLGLRYLTDGLKTLAGSRMRLVLERLTTNRFTGFLTGAGITAVIQSSSVTTVLVVSFASAGLMTLERSVGVILGAMVGSTVTGQIIAFKITEAALPLLIAGFVVQVLARREAWRSFGTMVLGLGLVFYGMKLMGDATQPLRSHEPFLEVMKQLETPLLSILVGAAFTAVVQSSSATTGIVILMASEGLLSLEAGIALVLGAKIGTCATALIAALGRPKEALRASLIHITVNVGSACLWVWFIDPLAAFLRGLGDDPARQVANAATAIALGSSVLFLGFTPWIARFVRLLVPPRVDERPRAEPRYLDRIYLATPAEAVERVRLEVVRLGDIALESLVTTLPRPGEELAAPGSGRQLAEDAQALEEAIHEYGVELTGRGLLEADSVRLGWLVQAAGQLAAISDSIAVRLDRVVREWQRKRLEASTETRGMLQELSASVRAELEEVLRALGEKDAEVARQALARREEIQGEVQALHWRIGQRLSAGGERRFDIFRLQTEFVDELENVHHLLRRVARSILALVG